MFCKRSKVFSSQNSIADTDQLRTSRLDNEVQHFLNQLPYQPGDVVAR